MGFEDRCNILNHWFNLALNNTRNMIEIEDDVHLNEKSPYFFHIQCQIFKRNEPLETTLDIYNNHLRRLTKRWSNETFWKSIVEV